MIVRATQKYVRMTPKKLRLVADVVRGKELFEVNEILSTLNKRAAKAINETIRQAVANAVNNMGQNEQDLTLHALIINEGPTFKRFRAGSRGRAKPYQKRTSHITVELKIENAVEKAPVAAAEEVAQPEVQAEAVKAEAKLAAKKPAAKKATAKKTTAKTKKETK